MKNLRIHAICVCMLMMSVCTHAQSDPRPPLNEPDYNKPRLFNNLPDKILVNLGSITPLFNNEIGTAVDFRPEANGLFRFEGQVVSTASSLDNKQQSVVVRSSNFIGAGLTISKINADDGTETYRGRIISLKHGDLFELQKEGNGYVLVKKNFYDLVNE